MNVNLINKIKAKRREKICHNISCYHIKKEILEQTSKHLQKFGKQQSEGLVFWVGYLDEKCDAHITGCKFPENENWKLGVSVDLQSMMKIIDELIKEDLVLLAQVHSHPGNFGHSCGDDLSASSYRTGFISIVVPNWGLIELNDLSKCFVHEYQKDWKWKLLSKEEVTRRFKID